MRRNGCAARAPATLASVFWTANDVVLVGETSFRFFSASSFSLGSVARPLRSALTSSVTLSATGVKALVALSTAIHRFFTATPVPT